MNSVFRKGIRSLLLHGPKKTWYSVKVHMRKRNVQISNASFQHLTKQYEVAETNRAAFAEYKNIHQGKEVVVLGSGPTLNQYIPIKDAIHIGVNKVCQCEHIILDYYFMQHFRNPGLSTVSFADDINKLRCKKFFGIYVDTGGGFECSESYFLQSQNAVRYFTDHHPQLYIEPNICFHPLSGGITIVVPALQFALFTNPKKIYLVGCDASMGGYFTSEGQGLSIKTARNICYGMVMAHHELKEFAQRWYPDTEIVSINPVNLKGLYRDLYTDSNGSLCDYSDTSVRYTTNTVIPIVDRSIEQVLIDRAHDEITCQKCHKSRYTMIRGLSDYTPNNIKLKCNSCESAFLYPPR